MVFISYAHCSRYSRYGYHGNTKPMSYEEAFQYVRDYNNKKQQKRWKRDSNVKNNFFQKFKNNYEKKRIEKQTKDKEINLLLKLAENLNNRKEYFEAIFNYEKINKLLLERGEENELIIENFIEIAKIYSENLNDNEEAINQYKKIIKINKKEIRAWNGLAISYEKLKNYSKAIKKYEKAIFYIIIIIKIIIIIIIMIIMMKKILFFFFLISQIFFSI